MNSFLNDTQNFLYYHGVADKIRWVPKFIDAISGEIQKFETGRRTGGRFRFLGNIHIPGRSLGNCVFISHLAPNLGKHAFFILSRENMWVPRPGDCAKNSKLKNVGF